MNCYCGEKAFTFTQITSRDGKKYTSLVGRCNKSLEDKKKIKKCLFKQEEHIETSELSEAMMTDIDPLPLPFKYKTREEYIKSLEEAINTIKMCQDTGFPFLKYTNRIIYLSGVLNIPPYIQEKTTIDEYYNIVQYYLKNPIAKPNPKPPVRYSLIDEITDKEQHNYFKNLLKINKSKPKAPQIKTIHNKNIIRYTNVEFRTGGLDNEPEPQEDEFDIEVVDSEEEQDDLDDDGNYSE